MTEHRPAADARSSGSDRTLFDRFVEHAHQRLSSAAFFSICVAIIIVWMASLPLWQDLKAWQVAIHTVGSVVTLILLALIENAGRRAEESSQEKLNVLAEGLAALMSSRAADDPDLEDAAQRLRDAVGLEDRH
ncbi:MAG: low affinity iron permease family protein [Solirubrobacterales bacterium]|nr:low affinity iron permease family protein [Solirubrobacterales bacterium]